MLQDRTSNNQTCKRSFPTPLQEKYTSTGGGQERERSITDYSTAERRHNTKTALLSEQLVFFYPGNQGLKAQLKTPNLFKSGSCSQGSLKDSKLTSRHISQRQHLNLQLQEFQADVPVRTQNLCWTKEVAAKVPRKDSKTQTTSD